MGDMSPMISTPLSGEVTQLSNGYNSTNNRALDDDTASNASLYLINQIASSLSNPHTMNSASSLSNIVNQQNNSVNVPLSCGDAAAPPRETLSDPFLPRYKRVSKLNKKNPVISCMLEDNPQFVTEPVISEDKFESDNILDSTPEIPEAVETAENSAVALDSTEQICEFQSVSDEVCDLTEREELKPKYVESETCLQSDSEPSVFDLESASESYPETVTTMNNHESRESGSLSNMSQDMEPQYSHPPLSYTTSSSSGPSVLEDENDSSILLLEKRSFRPFKNPEDYLYAMREDLAEWLNSMYELDINADNFFEKLETGEVLCQVSSLAK